MDWRYFGSGQARPLALLSNFAAAPIHLSALTLPVSLKRLAPDWPAWLGLRGRTFPSSEHVWQALKAYDQETFEAFCDDGRFTTVEAVFLPLFGRDPPKAQRKILYWTSRGMVGIAAKMAVNPKYWAALGLGRKAILVGREQLDPDLERDVWLAILRAKFEQNPALAEVLCGTGEGTTLVEFDRCAGVATYWGARRDHTTGQIIGRNVMGQYLMALRAAMLLPLRGTA